MYSRTQNIAEAADKKTPNQAIFLFSFSEIAIAPKASPDDQKTSHSKKNAPLKVPTAKNAAANANNPNINESFAFPGENLVTCGTVADFLFLKKANSVFSSKK